MTKAAGVLGRDLISWADINGNGLADYLFFNPSDGSITARLNTNKGQSFRDAQKVYSNPSFVGGVLQFANLNGLGRADLINVNVLSAKGKSSSNRCPPPTPPTGIGPNPNCADGTPDCDSGGGDNGGDDGGDGNDDGNDQSIYPLEAAPPSGRVKPTASPLTVWIALGDSYSAGPGAGKELTSPKGLPSDCKQHDNAYALQLAAKFRFQQEWYFYACTGAETEDSQKGVLTVQMPIVKEKHLAYGFALLSIGGNDVGFSKILKSCILLPTTDSRCNAAIDEARNKMNNELPDKLRRTWADIMTRMYAWTPVIYQQSYPAFFVADTPWCDDQSMNILIGFHTPKLSQDLRTRLNTLAADMQAVLRSTVEDYNNAHSREQGQIFLFEGRDQSVYPTHRFCESSPQNLDSSNTWIFKPFGTDVPPTSGGSASSEDSDNQNITAQEVQTTWDASTCAQDPQYGPWTEFSIGCEYALLIANGTVPDETTFALPNRVVKSFHPKSRAFEQIAINHNVEIRRRFTPSAIASDGGVVRCLPQGDAYGDVATYVSNDTAQSAIADFCHRAAGDTDVPNGAYAFSNSMILEISPDYSLESGCPKLSSTDADFLNLCTQSFQEIIKNCDPETDDDGNIRTPAKQGGAYYKQCVTWQIRKCDSENSADCPIKPFPWASPS